LARTAARSVRWTAAAILFPCLWGQPAALGQAGSAITVNAVRFWSLGLSTRIAVEISTEAKFRFEVLQNPDRLFVDIQESRSTLGDKIHVVKVGDKLVRQVRVAPKEGRVTRIVLDLEGPVAHEISQLANPNRIIIEVRAPGSRGKETPITQSRTGGERIEIAAAEPVKPEAPKPESPKKEAIRPEPARVETPRAETPVQTDPVRTETAPPPASASTVAAEPPRPGASNPAPGAPFRSKNYEPPQRAASPDPDGTPRAARPTSEGSRSLTRALGLKIGRIVLDPGHGGNDHGTTGPTGLTEKELVLDITMRLGALIEQRMGSEVVYTRKTDVYVGLEERTAIANDSRADLFLSIHANSSPERNISGAEVYYLNFSTSRDSLDVAARENAGHGKSIFELRELIQKIALKDKLDESREFATRVQASLSATWVKMNAAAKNRGVKKAPFVVLIGASMPSVLAEIGFISNSRDESMLKKPDQRQRIAEALYKGIEQYTASLGQVRAAQQRVPEEVQSSR